MTKRPVAIAAAFLIAIAAACAGGEQGASPTTETPDAAPRSASSTGTGLTPDAGSKVITVEMKTDEQGNNVFVPAHFDADRGDVIRYTLVSGVHNANFLPDSNPGKSNLPPAGPMLQLPQQTWDVKVTLEPGTYYFQCDPHALLGMIGHVTVK